MAIITTTADAAEEGTYILTAVFTDDAGASVIPDTDPAWSLYDADGDLVRSSTETAAASIDIVLSGDDLAIVPNKSAKRKVLITTTYTSDAGAGLPLTTQATFDITDLVGL